MNLQKKSFQASIFILFLVCALAPIILNTLINICLYSVRLSNDTVQEYNNVLSSLGKNIEIYMEEMERLSLSPYQHEDMISLYSYICNEKKDITKATGTLNNYIKKYESISTSLTAISSPDILGFTYFPIGKNYGKGFVYTRTDCRLHEFDAEEYPLETWIPDFPYAYKYTTYCAPHSVFYHNSKGQEVFSVIKPIRLFDTSRDLGILKVDASAHFFETLLSDIVISDYSCITILSENDEFIYSTNSDTWEKIHTNNPLHMFTTACTYTLEDSGWKLVYSISYVEFYSSIIESLFVSLILTILILSFSAWNYNRLTTYLTVPLQNILQTMHIAEQGDLTVRADESIGMNHEFEQITIQLNQMIARLDEHIKREYMAIISQKNAQYQALQAQINPHFLYNTLNIFIALNRIGERKLLEDSIIQLTRIFHYTCSNSGQSTLAEEFAFLEHYLSLQKIRFEDRLEFNLQLEEGTQDFTIPRLLIQPLVENSIVHGMEDCDRPTRVEVDASILTLKGIGECILIVVFDNGNGFDREALDPKNSVGLLNITERLQLFEPNSFFEIYSIQESYTSSFILIRKTEKRVETAQKRGDL